MSSSNQLSYLLLNVSNLSNHEMPPIPRGAKIILKKSLLLISSINKQILGHVHVPSPHIKKSNK